MHSLQVCRKSLVLESHFSFLICLLRNFPVILNIFKRSPDAIDRMIESVIEFQNFSFAKEKKEIIEQKTVSCSDCEYCKVLAYNFTIATAR